MHRYWTLPLVAGLDSDGMVYFHVLWEDGETLTFDGLYELHGLRLIAVVPINAVVSDFKAVAIFESVTAGE